MSRSGPSLDDLIRVQRQSVGLSDGQRAQNRARLLARVALGGAAATVASAGAAAALPAKASGILAGSWVARIAVTALLASGAGAVVYVAARPVSPPAHLAKPRLRVPATPLAPQPGVAEPQPASPELNPPSAVAPPGSAFGTSQVTRPNASGAPVGAPSASLATEVQLMHDVEAALRAGQPQRALTLLDQHRGAGSMAEERAVAHVVTLCQLGRVDAARQEAARFLRERPRSPLAARVRNTCAKPTPEAASEKPK